MRALLWFLIATATALRLALLLAGPDLDTDAYGHAMAGRFFLDTPADLRIHWVWLPLWHVVHAAVAAAGGALDHVRLLNVALGVLSPLLLARLLRRSSGDEVLAVTSGALLALWPLGVDLGQSGQPEPLFQVLLLAALVAWEEDRPAATGLLLALAALCRYEAWVLPPVFLALALRRRGVKQALAWGIPGLAVAGWCLVHGRMTGEFLWFLRANREFAREASRALGFPWGPEPRFWVMALWYPVIRPSADLLAFAPLPFLGLLEDWRRRERLLPASLLASGLVLLLFLSYGWVQRLNLGLHRHFYALVPLYATLSGLGLLALLRRFELLRRRERWLLPGALLAFLFVRTAPVARWNIDQHRRAFPSARAAAAVLRGASLTEQDRIVCDLSSTEQIGNLPRGLLVRRSAAALRPEEAVRMAPGGRVFVVARPRDVEGLRGNAQVRYEDHEQVVLELLRPPAGW
jgi:4-amino-4-deoxy-L-arabinose transferase-like glycosyltransferase